MLSLIRKEDTTVSANQETNRANAQHSTGPKTDEGKQRSSQNALRHGLTSQIVVMPGEDHDLYEAHKKSFFDEYKPQGATESNLVQSLADISWRQNRIVAIESNLLNFSTMVLMPDNDTRNLANLSLHSQRLARQFEKTVAQLRDLQSVRRARERIEFDDLLNIMEMRQSEGSACHPSEYGFVFSQPEIDRAITLRKRDNEARKAYNSASA
jgi:hypothetical protein